MTNYRQKILGLERGGPNDDCYWVCGPYGGFL